MSEKLHRLLRRVVDELWLDDLDRELPDGDTVRDDLIYELTKALRTPEQIEKDKFDAIQTMNELKGRTP